MTNACALVMCIDAQQNLRIDHAQSESQEASSSERHEMLLQVRCCILPHIVHDCNTKDASERCYEIPKKQARYSKAGGP